MSKTGFEVVARAVTFIFLRGSLYRASYCKCECVSSVMPPIGDKMGYVVDGRLVANGRMKEVFNDE